MARKRIALSTIASWEELRQALEEVGGDLDSAVGINLLMNIDCRSYQEQTGLPLKEVVRRFDSWAEGERWDEERQEYVDGDCPYTSSCARGDGPAFGKLGWKAPYRLNFCEDRYDWQFLPKLTVEQAARQVWKADDWPEGFRYGDYAVELTWEPAVDIALGLALLATLLTDGQKEAAAAVLQSLQVAEGERVKEEEDR